MNCDFLKDLSSEEIKKISESVSDMLLKGEYVNHERMEAVKMKKGKFAFRLWFIKVLIESLMKSDIDEYAGSTIVARRTKKWLLEGYSITDELIETLASTHSTIAKLEKSCLDPVGGLKEKA